MSRSEWEVEPVDLFAWLKALPLYPKFYWANRERNFAIAGVGQAPATPSSRLFGWRHFSPTQSEEWNDFAPASFTLPRFELKIEKGRTIFAENSEQPASFHLAKRQQPFLPPHYLIETQSSLPNRAEWIETTKRALDAIQNNAFEKVVLARRLSLDCQGPIEPIALCEALSHLGQTSFLFQPTPESAFLGASPERLYRRTKRQIECDALAGTRPIAQAIELLKSEKDLREFLVVKEKIIEALAPLCTTPPNASPYKIRATPTLAHLHSEIIGTLKEGVDDESILTALHPTPAVGGWPKNAALSFLSTNEPFARGLYAAPVGWKSPEEAEFSVGIRSCLIHRRRAYLYAGTGIVAGSDPHLEWEESEQKLAPWKKFFFKESPVYANRS